MLPAEATPFFGRTTELAQLTALLSQARLITVTGTAGVGKTRLALRAAAQATSRFADGVHLVELSALRDPELLPQAIAAGLGLEAQGTRPTVAALLGYLGDRNLLLILDTCEHLIDACAAFAESLLTQTTRVTMLATSRQSFDIPGENGYPLAPLRVAGAGTPHAFGEAVDFFAARAADAIPGFAVTPGNEAEVARLCRRLDGVPLALELAAAGLRARPLAELADDTLLADETLRAAIGRSYDLCTPAEQALWQRLTVFAGTFDCELAGAVCAGKDLPRDDILTTIVGLVDKSVLVRDEAADDEGRTRYRLLGTIREFGAERLAGSGTQTGVRDRFIGRYLTMARYFRDHFLDDDQLERYRQLRLDHANLDAALEYTLEGDDGEWRREGAELATALSGYWIAAGLFQEGRDWLDKALDRFPDPVPERAMVLVTRGYLGARQSGGDGLAGRADQVRQADQVTRADQVRRAVADVRDGIELATGLGEQRTGARGYLYLNLALTQAGEVDEALESGIEARRQLTAIGDQIGLITLDAQLGHTYQLAGDPAKAIECYEDGLGLLGNSRERWLHGDLHIMAALAFRQQTGRVAECAAALRLALRCKHDMRDVAGIAFALEVLGWLAAEGGQHERAARLLGGADSLRQQAGTVALDDLVAAALDETGDQPAR